MYEIYVETCGQDAQNQVNPAMFGKLVRLVFPDLGTRRLGTRGSARYHYDGIYIKKSSFFYAHYCYLLGEKSYPSEDAVAFEKSTDYSSIIQEEMVEDLLTSFWRSLQQDTIMLMLLPDVHQLLKCYDTQLYKGIEDVLLHDFLEDVSIQYLKSVRIFSKKFKLWLLNALEGFPTLLQISKLKEVTVFVQRLRRKTYLSNMAKTMRMVLKNNRRVSVLKSDLHAIVNQGALDISKKALASDHEEGLESHTEMKCSWHLFHLLLLEYVIHILQSYIEEEEEEEDMGNLKDMLPDDQSLIQPVPALFHPLDSPPTQECASPSAEPPWVTLKHTSQSPSPVGMSNMILRVLGFLVDTATGNKLIQVLLEDKATESAIKLSLPVGQEALITLKDGQKFVIHISDVPQSSENIYFRESNANMQDGLFE
ncbi:DNA-binding protein RFX8 [Sciurus carolinensis]|uniref:DNA-binding protein RFX8 n=1 Tax=Sciurus carolinensis TaxID=30640 RepID=A0AA41SPD0_SCICA|nr:DNA-binding protein RFX8 [Sciurus carolinensis]